MKTMCLALFSSMILTLNALALGTADGAYDFGADAPAAAKTTTYCDGDFELKKSDGTTVGVNISDECENPGDSCACSVGNGYINVSCGSNGNRAPVDGTASNRSCTRRSVTTN
jgi:hypothetical protein